MAVVKNTRWLAWEARQPRIFREDCLSCAGIADDDPAGAFGEKLQIHEAQDARVQLHAALVVLEMEAVDRVARMQP